ncbi:hypothetical protein TWF970_005920 [Orbilia oligospora]|uniref:Uncharacterized protein n=1 Tax=Orbilia oligospora TaxID=2813651 RepID=A0A7C8RAN0_ORBOL|nr:hypothetical protein TWF970_005920 [Orbilia oligospora]
MRFSRLFLGFILPAFEASTSIIPPLEKSGALVSQLQGNLTIPQDSRTAWQVNQTILAAPSSFKPENTETSSSSLMEADLVSSDQNISDLFRKSGQNHDSARTINSKTFYTWRVVCPTHQRMRYIMNPNPEAYPKIGGRRRPNPKDRQTLICLLLKAAQEKGAGVEWQISLQNAQLGSLVAARLQCTNPKLTLKVHSKNIKALDNIPFFVKSKNPGWRWRPVDRFSMSWNKMGSSNDGSSSYRATYDKQLDPGTIKEPYDLEGPDEFDPQEKETNLEWLRTPFWRSEGSYNSGSELAWKRSRIEGIGKDIKQDSQAQDDLEFKNSPEMDTERAVAS